MAHAAFDKLKQFVYDVGVDLTSANAVGVALVQESNATIITSAATVEDVMSISPLGDTSLPLTQVSGTGYSSPGQYLQNVIVSATGGIGYIDADDLTWTNSTISAGGALMYLKGATPETGIPLAYYDLSVTRISTNGPFTLQWNNEGLLTIE